MLVDRQTDAVITILRSPIGAEYSGSLLTALSTLWYSVCLSVSEHIS